MNDSAIDDSSEESIRSLISYVARALVDDDDSVRVTLTPNGQDRLTVELWVSPDDLGKMIGKQGRTARSMRTILQAFSAKYRKHSSPDIQIDPAAACLSSGGTNGRDIL